jgi:hypothetical protein
VILQANYTSSLLMGESAVEIVTRQTLHDYAMPCKSLILTISTEISLDICHDKYCVKYDKRVQ